MLRECVAVCLCCIVEWLVSWYRCRPCGILVVSLFGCFVVSLFLCMSVCVCEWMSVSVYPPETERLYSGQPFSGLSVYRFDCMIVPQAFIFWPFNDSTVQFFVCPFVNHSLADLNITYYCYSFISLFSINK